MPPQSLLLDECEAIQGKRIGIATLNSPDTLNALTQPLLDALTAQLHVWRTDPSVVCVVIQGAGDRALCAGGEVVGLYHLMRETPGQPNTAAEHFLASEYRLHYTLHTFGKPVLGWGHGVAMGSGLGILVGASHKVVTETSRFAMPEVGIGIFPDAGATWFLPRMPDRIGLYLGLTGTMCNAGDALCVGLGDYLIGATAKDDIFTALSTLSWGDTSAHHHAALTAFLQDAASAYRDDQPESALQARAASISQLMSPERVEDIMAAVQEAARTDDWFRRGADALQSGSPTSARIFIEQYRRGPQLSLKEAFQLEAVLAIHCVRHTDFAEGIRARLVDKDLAPRWTPATLAQVSPDQVASFFTLPPDYDQNPLADLL